VRLLLDSCVWGGARKELAVLGHDAIWAGDWPQDPGDEEILSRANAEERILVTLDKDFGELAIVRGRPHCGIIRLVNIPVRQFATVCHEILSRYSGDLASKSLITVTEDRIRIRASN
jgi:predicted nuclease of predicted toxin-antitoxin system